MNRGTGTGLIALGIVMSAVGAILEFAVSATAKGFSIHTLGIILLIVGIATFVIGALVMAFGGKRRTTIREDVRAIPGGHERIEQADDWATR
jgi:uncharacterized membrane protein YidH (DUF202 family)